MKHSRRWLFFASAVNSALGSVSLNGDVRGMKADGGILYVVGAFTSATDGNGTITRNGAAAVDTATGLWTSWNPNITSPGSLPGKSIQITSSSVYIAGDFATIGGVSRAGIAKVNKTDGAVDTAFNASVTSLNAMVSCLAGTSAIYIFGQFSVGSIVNIVKLSLTTGAADTAFNCHLTVSTDAAYCGQLSADEATLYIGGGWLSVNSTTRNHLASVSATTGSLNSFDPSVTPANNSTHVDRMFLAGSNLYLVGNYTGVGVTTRNRAAIVDTSATLQSFNPNLNNPGRWLIFDSTQAYLSGDYTTVGGTTRKYISRVDSTSGALDTSFNASMTHSSCTMWSVERVSSTIIAIGGTFGAGADTVGGKTRNRIAFLNSADGSCI